MITDTDLAWLAGWWDGEGSIGIMINMQRQYVYLIPAVQASTTDALAVANVKRIWEGLQVASVSYTYQEKKPERHKDATHVKLNRSRDIAIVASSLIPYAVTKKHQWELMLEFVQSRLVDRDMDGSKIKRGGNTYWPYIRREVEIAIQLRAANHRGPTDPKAEAWYAKANQLMQEAPIERSVTSRRATSARIGLATKPTEN